MQTFQSVSRVWLLLLFLSRIPVPAFAFQITNANPVSEAPAAGKYIFYWNNLQCTLLEETGYSGTLHTTPAGFRQMLLHTPYLWNGSTLLDHISFTLEGQRVDASRDGHDYNRIISLLDETLGQRVASGQALRLTGLSLGLDEATGSIDIILEAPQDQPASPAASRNTPTAGAMNTSVLEKVIWGREDIYENANRDFFSETEFWQTVQQLPYVEWKIYATPVPLAASIRISDPNQVSFGLVAVLEPAAYRSMVQRLEHYKHLLKPGSVVSLTIHTAEQHDQMFEKTMYIVAGSDPRLALRRNRDSHTLEIAWGGWREKLDNLYLLQLKDTQGNIIAADPPIQLNRSVFDEADFRAIVSARPDIRIDGQLQPEISFRLSAGGRTTVVGPGQPIPDSLDLVFPSEGAAQDIARLDSIQTPGYALPQLAIVINKYTLRTPLMVRNDFRALLATAGSVRIKLFDPVLAGNHYRIDYELPEPGRIILSVFDTEGTGLYVVDQQSGQGRNTAVMPKNIFIRPGKYHFFLNTLLGVAHQELVIE
ncbi:MAG: hypothetical protein IPH12_14990 [Saprospirales bacterium]|nr:hypothetical protein [Saprospirales bacterium]